MIRAQRRAHRRAWRGLAVLIPLLLASALFARAHHAHVLAPSGLRASTIDPHAKGRP